VSASSCASALPFSHVSVVRAALAAPSPDNNQPWRFVSAGDRLLIYLDPDRALPSDVRSMFDLIGTGAAVENVRIAARQMGRESLVECGGLTPGAGRNGLRLAATIRFAPGGQPDPLFPYLTERCTCRRLFSARPLPGPCLAGVSCRAAEFPDVRLDWVTDRPRIRAFAGLFALSDGIRLEYEPFHNEVFRQLRFSAEEAERTRDGLDLRTLELPPGAARLLRWLRPWPRMRRLHRLGLGRLLTIPSALAVLKSGALGVLSVPEPTPEEFLRGGRALERIWLSAQAEGLSLQPLGSLSIFFAHVQLLGGRRLSPRHAARVARLMERFRHLVPWAPDRVLLLLFRLGRSAPPRFRSLRRRVEEVIECS
jgi:hypothetical protein